MYDEIYFMLTEACPNRCKYCYIKNRGVKNTIDLDTVISKVNEHNPQRIIFFGGEPLLELDKIKYLTKKYYGKIKLQVVTSTSANFKEFMTDIYEKTDPRLFDLQVSWDGFMPNRINAAGENIAQKTYEMIEWAKEFKRGFDIKCVISEDNVSNLLDIHDKFLNYYPKYNISGQFVIAHRVDATNDYFSELGKLLPETFDLRHAYSLHLNMLVAYLNHDIKFMSCDAGKYIVIKPDGSECYCTALSQDNDNESFTRMGLQEPCYSDDCAICKYAYICDGGCRYERYKVFGDKWKDNHLSETCKMMEIWDSCFHKWWDNSSYAYKQKIVDKISQYNAYKRSYYEGV